MSTRKVLTNSAIMMAALAAATPALACDTNDFKCSLQAASTPTDQPWTEPARATYTINGDADDSIAIDVAGRAVFDLGLGVPLFALADVTWNRNNQQDKRQNNFQTGAGLHLELNTISGDDSSVSRDAWSFFLDGRLAYNRKGVYANAATPACVANPTAVICNTQVVESVRGTIDFSPHFGRFESNQPFAPLLPDGSTGRLQGHRSLTA